jgi:hypothetical protein
MKNFPGTSIASDPMDIKLGEPTSTRQRLVEQATDINERLERVANNVEMIQGVLFGERSQSDDPKDGGINSLEGLLNKSHWTLNDIEERLQGIVDRL